MMHAHYRNLIVFGVLVAGVMTGADSSPDRIDQFISARYGSRGITPAPLCDDRTFVRRVCLDLAGRIPTVEEAAAFLNDPSSDKRAALVDKLLATDEHAQHLTEVFDVVLMGRKGEQVAAARTLNQWHDWLRSQLRANRPWNELVRELIVARPQQPEDRGAVWFVFERRDNYQEIAEALAPIIYGARIDCAQCHDHFVAREIKQLHYWGLVAAFNRSKPVMTPEGPRVAESAVGGFLNFTNLRKESAPATLTLFTGKTIEEPRPADGTKEEDSPDKYVIAPPASVTPAPASAGQRRQPPVLQAKAAWVPKYSRREQLAEAATTDNPLLARALVNRAWALMMGRGLVHPVDEMDSQHPPSHPELLDWLARDFEQNGYDVRRLLRTLALTRTYQLESRPDGNPQPDAFAHGLEKPLSAEVLFRSLLVATGTAPDSGLDTHRLRVAFIEKFPDLFAREYNATLAQAMFLTNSPIVEELLKPRPGNLTQRMLALTDDEARVRLAFQHAFGRAPDAAELQQSLIFLAARRTRAEAGVKQLLWALVTSAEFLVNH